ncbi:hypothetical protein CQA53_05800 [Helicobacter didelphidarum]|uniref:IrrE N-terminal-like domain-containing protein n=1 Tax=Helicobacter didelphidarum TaxID=2040648 RepID=A0A3D8ILL5_9HELI|nr:ImmA/IrrE family metallo-endopeptidase [Helicobacter didelphidarum]RDU65806.1 hypothetical protein CQA53_05800 [Helicobacter didelphidarum]
MLPNAQVINEAISRNNIPIDTMAQSIFKDNANKFLSFLKNPTQSAIKISSTNLVELSQYLNIPFGYLFLQELPKEKIKIPELRSKNNKNSISKTLINSVKESEYKQEWYRDYLISIGEEAKHIKKYYNEQEIIKAITSLINFEKLPKKPYEALNKIIDLLQKENYLIFISSRIHRKNTRSLDIDEFRGYCLYDKYTPVIFLHNQDSYKGKIFTILHELAHIMYRYNGITTSYNRNTKIEKLCNAIAGEILIPKDRILSKWNKNKNIQQNLNELSHEFNLASDEAIATKARWLKLISQKIYDEFIEECKNKPPKKPYAPNNEHKVYKQIIKENSQNFTQAILTQTLNNKLDFNLAMQYLGIKEMKYFKGIREVLKL